MTNTKNSPGGQNVSVHTDPFAEIATARFSSQRELLETPPRAHIPDRILPWGEEPFPCKSPADIRNPEEMHTALAGLREQYRAFLQDVAPEIPRTRNVLEFREFSWRIESPEDRLLSMDDLATQDGWTPVTIPHYGPPLGKAATLYRREFELPDWATSREVLSFHFGGVDYRCQVYLNGRCIGTHEGFFEEFRLDASWATRPGKNVLLIRVENDFTMLGENIGGIKPDGDKIYAATGLGYDEPELGWHHCPAAMGIWNFVRLEGLSRLFIDDLWVRPLPETEEIEIYAEVESRSSNLEEDVTLIVSVFGQNFEATVHEDLSFRGEAAFVRGFGDLVHGFDERFPSLMGSGKNYLRFRLPMAGARTWNPETPWLYQLQARLQSADGILLDAAKVQFGMRSFRQDEESEPKGKFYLNDREIRLRGANTMGNFERCIMKGDQEGLHDQILLAKLTNLNFLRMTQRPVHREFYDACDRLGMMTQTDLPLFSTIRRTQFSEVARQAGCMERHVRRHCCNILVSFINEPRPAAGSKPHRFLQRDEMESLFDICARTVRFHHPGRVVKYVDGDYDPPSSAGMPDNHVYCGWYLGHGVDLGALHRGDWLPVKPGWHFGCGEFGAEGLDSYEVMESEYPLAWRPKSPDAPWSPEPIAMSQSYKYHWLWYDSASTAAGWINASQEFQAWVIGLMTHAFRRLERLNTFAIHLFIDAWPAGWMKTIMDVHCNPKKAWFVYRDSLQPLIVSLRSDRMQVSAGERVPVELWLCNDLPEATSGLCVEYHLLLDGQPLRSGRHPVEAPACQPVCQGILDIAVPEVTSRGRLELSAVLVDSENRAIHRHQLTLEVFPKQTAKAIRVWCPGSDADSLRFLNRLGCLVVDSPENADSILVSDPSILVTRRAEISAAVSNGTAAILLGMKPGTYEIGGKSIEVREAGMGPRHFVSRATGHPLVEGFGPDDFRFWFHESLGRVAPILHTILDGASGWTTILQSGDGGWTKPWQAQPAAAELRDHLGVWRICQIELRDCIEANPAAAIFAQRLLSNPGNSRRD